MSRETDSVDAIAEMQRVHDDLQRTANRMHDLLTFGSKALATLNGAAVAATLAFIQALVNEPTYGEFKPYGVAALIIFIVGAFVASMFFLAQYWYVNWLFIKDKKASTWRFRVWLMIGISASCVLLGGILITIGIVIAT